MTGPSRDADADVITAGRAPRFHRAPPGLVRLLVIAQTAALIAVIAVALHYRAEAGRPGYGRLPASGPRAPMLPEMRAAVRSDVRDWCLAGRAHYW